ncbi:MAG: sialidase family protein [Egibacteraceae bacterium]
MNGRRRGLASVVAVAWAGLVMAAPGVAGADVVPVEVPVTAMDQGAGVANNSPTIAVDPTEPRFVVIANRLDAPHFGCALQLSGDGGAGWVTVDVLPELPEGAETCYAPEVAFDADGVLYYVFVGLAGSGNQPMGVFLTTSRDRGQTFTTPRQVLGSLKFSVRMAIDRDAGDGSRLHLVWIDATSEPPLGGFGPPPNPIMAAHSDDGGATFSAPVQVSHPALDRVVAPALALGPDGDVHVAYYDLEDDAIDYQGLEGPPVWPGTWSLVLAGSTDRGASFRAHRVVDDAVEPHERVLLVFTMPPPALVTDRHGEPCVAWTDARHGDADVLLRCAGDRGNERSQPQRLNDDSVGNGRSQYMPRLAVSPTGRIDAIFYDRREDPDDLATHIYLTSSADDGHSFAPNRPVTAEPFDPRIGQRYVHPAASGLVEFGSRLGLLPRADGVLAAWTDTRNSEPGTTGQDVFAASVSLPRATHGRDTGGTLPTAVLAAAALAVVVPLVGIGARRHRHRRADARSGT